MKDLLIKAQGLVDDLNAELQSAKEKNAEANRLSAAARIQKNKLDAKEIDLNKREKDVAAGENPVKAAEEARRIQTENAALAGKLEEQKNDLEKKKLAFAGEVSAHNAEFAKQKAEIENTRENFRKQADALAEEKKKFEQKLKDLGIK